MVQNVPVKKFRQITFKYCKTTLLLGTSYINGTLVWGPILTITY